MSDLPALTTLHCCCLWWGRKPFLLSFYMRGTPPKLELSSGGQAPCSTYRLPLLGECSRNPSVSVCQLALLWEAVFSFSELFWKTLHAFAISWWVIYEHICPHCAECSAVFVQKWHDTRAPPSLFTPFYPEWLFFVSLVEKSPQRETFCQCGRGETKNSRSTKRHQNRQVQKLF